MISKLSKPQLQAYVHRVAGDSARLAFTDHALLQMKRRDITRDMAIEVVRRGRLNRTPEPNRAKGNIECRMEHFLTGRDLAVIVAVSDDEPDLIVITAMEL